jgi:two-component system NarL family sensor kinase
MTPESFPRLPLEIETAIFRVVQEALTNVYRHSQSSTTRVEVERLSDTIVLRIRDFGKGVPFSSPLKRTEPTLGVGITGMRERVRQLGGELTVRRAEPGTLVEAHIPAITI